MNVQRLETGHFFYCQRPTQSLDRLWKIIKGKKDKISTLLAVKS